MKLITYINNRGIYNISALETAAGMPPRTLANAVSGYRELPDRWVYPLMKALGPVEIEGWQIHTDPEEPLYIGRCIDEDRELLTREIDSHGTIHVEYYVPEFRRHWGELEFLRWIKTI